MRYATIDRTTCFKSLLGHSVVWESFGIANTVTARRRSKEREFASEDIASAYEHSGYSPDEITQLYPDLSLGDVHRALAYYYDHIDDFRTSSSEPTSA